MWGNTFLLSLRAIRRNLLRSFLTVLGIVIGVAAVVTMVTVGNGATRAVREQISSLGSNLLQIRPGQRLGPGGGTGAPPFKEADVDAIRDEVAGLKAVAPEVRSAVTVVANGKNWSTTITGSNSTRNRVSQVGRLMCMDPFRVSAFSGGVLQCHSGTRHSRAALKGNGIRDDEAGP